MIGTIAVQVAKIAGGAVISTGVSTIVNHAVKAVVKPENLTKVTKFAVAASTMAISWVVSDKIVKHAEDTLTEEAEHIKGLFNKDEPEEELIEE